MRIGHKDTKRKNEKLSKRRRGLGHVTYFSNFGTPVISLELLKIQTSNFACWWKVSDTKSKVKNWPKDGLAYVTWPTFQILEPLIFLKRLSWKYKPQILHVVRDQILNKKCKTSQKGAWPRLCATSKSGDILNIQATEALKNGKIRESIAFDTVTKCELGVLTLSWTKKSKN